jgi:TRAP-type C4-dicarboxylate transport system permease small subunit
VEHAKTDHAQADGTTPPAAFEDALGAMLMFVLFIITLANVVTRYLTNISFAFTEEVSVALMVVMAFVGASVAVTRDRHLRMTYLIDKTPTRARAAFEQIALVATLGTFLVLTAYGAVAAYQDWRDQVRSPGLDVPQWLYTIWLPIFSALIVIRSGRISLRRWTARN